MTTLLVLALALATASVDSVDHGATEVLPVYGALAPGMEAPWLAGWTLADTVWNIDRTAAADRTVLVFWATWCAPCREGLQRLAAAEDRLAAAGVEVVLVNLDAQQRQIAQFVAEEPPVFTCVLDPFQANTRAFFGLATRGSDTLALPRTVILDRDRRVLALLGREGADYVDRLLQEWDPLPDDLIPSRR